MYKHILIAADGSEVGRKGLEHGLSLAGSLKARVTIVTVTEPYPIYAGGDFGTAPNGAMIANYSSGQDETANTILAAAEQAAKHANVKVETVHVADAQPGEAIIEAAKSHNCDLIVMGSHGRRGIGRLVLGSKTWEVVAHGQLPVLVVR